MTSVSICPGGENTPFSLLLAILFEIQMVFFEKKCHRFDLDKQNDVMIQTFHLDLT